MYLENIYKKIKQKIMKRNKIKKKYLHFKQKKIKYLLQIPKENKT